MVQWRHICTEDRKSEVQSLSRQESFASKISNFPLAPQPIKGLTIDCWTHFHLSADRSTRSSSQYRVEWSARRIPVVVGFLYQDYYCKSIATQIPHNGLLVPIPYTSRKCLHQRVSNPRCIPQRNSKQYALMA